MQAVIRHYHEDQVALLRTFWTERRPDLVASLAPNFNRALRESLAGDTPFVTILTDLADFPPHFWIERQPQHFICGTARAVHQARGMGHPACRVIRVSGMILHPRFYEPVDVDRGEERRRLGLKPDTPTGLVLFGGQGSGAMREIANRLDRSGLDVQLILICRRNLRLAWELRAARRRMPVFVEGFTTETSEVFRQGETTPSLKNPAQDSHCNCTGELAGG
jgi:1,2-diacylglycerol 3-beta-galactosyltransferase